MKFKTINGWTKTRILKVIKENFTKKSTVGFSCKYKTPDGARCAVGLFIPDSFYRPEMDTAGEPAIHHIWYQFPELQSILPIELKGLSEMQKVHDGDDASTDFRSDEKIKMDLIEFVKNHVITSRKRGVA